MTAHDITTGYIATHQNCIKISLHVSYNMPKPLPKYLTFTQFLQQQQIVHGHNKRILLPAFANGAHALYRFTRKL